MSSKMTRAYLQIFAYHRPRLICRVVLVQPVISESRPSDPQLQDEARICRIWGREQKARIGHVAEEFSFVEGLEPWKNILIYIRVSGVGQKCQSSEDWKLTTIGPKRSADHVVFVELGLEATPGWETRYFSSLSWWSKLRWTVPSAGATPITIL